MHCPWNLHANFESRRYSCLWDVSSDHECYRIGWAVSSHHLHFIGCRSSSIIRYRCNNSVTLNKAIGRFISFLFLNFYWKERNIETIITGHVISPLSIMIYCAKHWNILPLFIFITVFIKLYNVNNLQNMNRS